MGEYKKCNVPTCHNDMGPRTFACEDCFEELIKVHKSGSISAQERTNQVSTHIPKHDKRHGPFGKCCVHDCESTAHEQTKLCQSHQDASKCCFDDCDNVTHRHWCYDCTEKKEHALTTWEKAGSLVFSSRTPNSIEFYNQQLKAKAELHKKVEQPPKIEEKPIPPIKCRCCDNDRVRGSKECNEGHNRFSATTCQVGSCSDKPATTYRFCRTHMDSWMRSPTTYEEFMSKFESEEDYRKSQEHAKKKEDMATLRVNVDIDQEQLKRLGEKVQAAYERQVRERMQGLQFDFIAPTGFGPVTIPIRGASEVAAGQALGANAMSFPPNTKVVQASGDASWNPSPSERRFVAGEVSKDEHKHAESCGQLSLQQVQAIIDKQHQEEVDARKEAHDNLKRSEVESTTQEATMSKTNINTLPVIKEDLEATAWRIAGKQFTKLTRDPIVAAIARGLGDDSESGRAKVAAFLKTELGTAIYQGMLSTGLSFMPQATGDIPQKMARELRVSAMTSAGDQVADLLMEPLRQVASLYLSGTPQEVPALGQDTTSVKADVTIPVTVEAKR